MKGKQRQSTPTGAAPAVPAPLSPHWAFVVQLREGTVLTAEALHGRVEHIVTGQAALFSSPAELLAFMEWVLTAREGKAS